MNTDLVFVEKKWKIWQLPLILLWLISAVLYPFRSTGITAGDELSLGGGFDDQRASWIIKVTAGRTSTPKMKRLNHFPKRLDSQKYNIPPNYQSEILCEISFFK